MTSTNSIEVTSSVANDEKSTNKVNEGNKKEPETFVYGVIEGFYHRPWTRKQRLSLFKRMSKHKLNSYLYAPKDDAKHRSQWRELYTDEESCQLKQLIDSCRENQVTFYYGLSPGLDMVYSDPAEVDLLRAKTSQLLNLGCEGFSLLWDDIEPELSTKDAKHFKSFSEAHCTVSNAIFNHLDQPKFLFCPVEYCSSRAVPSVKDSEYLATIGFMLHPNIQVFWTGSKVVSRSITAKECEDLSVIIRRKPVIWDNLHANDYDQQRVFLGPYLGRDHSPSPQTYLAGAMTNPNCEFSLNIPAISSLADWAFNRSWDPTGLSSHREAVKELLEETQEGEGQDVSKEDILTEEDLDLVCQMFWLPHSHGPVVNRLLVDFRYCRDNARAMVGWKGFEPGDQPDYVDEWINRAINVNKICKQFFGVCDKMTHVPNRDLMFDLNPYLNNVRVSLHACNNYLKWVGLQDCSKPIRGGPSLAGLVGGLAGELSRLYPIQEEEQYPLKAMVTPSSNAVFVLPYKFSSRKYKKELDNQFGIEIEELTDFLDIACQSFLIKLKKGNKSSIVGLFSSWDMNGLDGGEEHVKLRSKYHDIFKTEEVKGKFSILVKMLLANASQVMDPELLHDLLDCVLEDKGGVVISLGLEQKFLHRFLTLQGFKKMETDVSISGQLLLCK